VGGESTGAWTSSAKVVFESNPGGDGGGRKIFSPPDIVEEEAYCMLFFGTGDRAHPGRKDVIDRIYAIKETKDTAIIESDLIDVTSNELQDPDVDPEDKADIRYNLLYNPNYHGWFIRLLSENDNSVEGEKALSRGIVFRGVLYMTTFTPPGEEVLEDPCLVAQGKAQLYALKYTTGEAVFNFEPGNDQPNEAVIMRADRSQVIGSGIPSDVVIVIQNGNVYLYVTVGLELTGTAGGGMGVFGGDMGEGGNLLSVYWRELS
jgi:type IV pilus assembly protein PilY1